MDEQKFSLISDVFSANTMSMLHKHCNIYTTDKSSYAIWPDSVSSTVECFSHTLTGKDRITVLYDLCNNADIPCDVSLLKTSDIAIQKIPPGGSIGRHADNCHFSLTVFLNDIDQGGEFVWLQGDQKNIVQPIKNHGIFAYYNGEHTGGADHEVNEVKGSVTRYTLQLFVFDKTGTHDNKYRNFNEKED